VIQSDSKKGKKQSDSHTSYLAHIESAATNDVVETIEGKKKGKLADAIGIGIIAGLIYYLFPFPAL
jgi:hypothetical protein